LHGQGAPGTTSDAAESGVAVHAALAEILAGKPASRPLDDDDAWVVSACMGQLAQLRDLGLCIGIPLCEHRVTWFYERREVELSATIDAVWPADGPTGTTCLLDWKTGYNPVPPEQVWQLRLAAAILASKLRPQSEQTFWLGFAQPRLGVIDHETATVAQCHAWLNEIVDAVYESESLVRRGRADMSDYTRGGHCAHCPGAMECPATRRDVALLRDGDQPIAELTPDQVAALWPVAKALEKRIEAFKEIARAMVSPDRPLPLANGMELREVERPSYEIIVPAVAEYLEITEGIPADQVYRAAKMTKAELDRILKFGLKRGEGARAAARWEGLVASGAVEIKTRREVREVKKIQEVTA